MTMYIKLPKSAEFPDGKDACGFFKDFDICDDTVVVSGPNPYPCGSSLIWDGCAAGSGKWYCVTRQAGYQWWCVEV
jgi:hypothetical protein